MEINELIRTERKRQKVTVESLIKMAKLDVNAPQFSHWESGKRIPTPEDLEKLCGALKLDLKLAFSLWAKAHMPTQNLKALFTPKEVKNAPGHATPAALSMSFPVEKTLSLQPRDAEWFAKNPEALTILTRCLMAGLASEAWAPAKLSQGFKIAKPKVDQHLKTLLKMKYIEKCGSGYRTPNYVRFIHIPETADFLPVRKARIRFITDHILTNVSDPKGTENLTAFARLFQNRLSQPQAQYLLNGVKGIFHEILDMEPPESEKTDSYYLMIAMGKEYPN